MISIIFDLPQVCLEPTTYLTPRFWCGPRSKGLFLGCDNSIENILGIGAFGSHGNCKRNHKEIQTPKARGLVLRWCRGENFPQLPFFFRPCFAGFFGPSGRSSQHAILCGPSVELEWYGETSLNHIKAISRRLVFFWKPLYCFKNGWKKHKQCIRKPKTSVYFHKPLESCIMIRYIWIYISHLCDVSFWKNHVDHSRRAGVTSIEPFLHVNLNHGNLRGPPPPMPRFLLK